MQKEVRNIANIAAQINFNNKKKYQESTTKTYHEGDELLENILLTKQLQFNKEKVLPLLIYNFISGKRYLYVCLTNMYERLSEFLDTVDISDEELTAVVSYLAKVYIQVCDGDVLDTRKYSSTAVDLYKMYFENRNKFPLFEDFKNFFNGNVDLIKTKNIDDVINYGVIQSYDSENVARLSIRIIEILSKKIEDIAFLELEELVMLLWSCGLSLSYAQKVGLNLRNKMLERFSVKLENILKPVEKTEASEKEQEKSQNIPKKVKETKPSKYISDKEYKSLLKEVKKYYNPYTRELTNEFISSEERERIAAIMIRLGLEQYQVVDFLKKTETVSKTYTYEYFKDHVEEFEYYFGENLSQVHEYMKEIETCTEDEDKEYWIMGINEELAKLENSYKLDSYEYERQVLVQRKLGSNE